MERTFKYVNHVIKEYNILITCVFITLLNTIMSYGLSEGFSYTFIKFLMYLPLGIYFLVFMHRLYRKKDSNYKLFFKKYYLQILFLFIVIYCLFLFIYRFFTNLAYMEGLHYAIRLIGSIGIYYVVSQANPEKTTKNLILYAGILDIALIADFSFNKTFRFTHILSNVLVNCLIIVMLSFVCLHYIKKNRTHNSVYNVICGLHFFMLLFVVFLSGSRTMLVVGGIAILYILISIIFLCKNKTKFLSSLVASSLAIIVLFSLNFGDTQFYVTKQLHSIMPSAFSSSDQSQSGTTGSDQSQSNTSNSVNLSEIKSLEKTSDHMRSVLKKQGLDEVNKNFIFGTGNVLFDYILGEKKIEQSAHNFIIETLVAFGAIGTLFLTIWIALLFINMIRNKRITLFNKVILFLASISVAAFAYNQEILYNYITLPVLFAIIGLIESTGKHNIKDC